MKNLAFFIPSLSAGGAERVVSILSKEFAAYYNVYIFIFDRTINYSLNPSVNLIYLKPLFSLNSNFSRFVHIIYFAVKLRYFCVIHGIDYVFSFMYRPNLSSVISKLIGNKAKIIISERNTPSLVYSSCGVFDISMRMLIRMLVPFADRIIANSMSNASDLINNFGVPKSLISTIYNPIDLSYVAASSSVSEFLYQPSSFKFISVSRFVPHKRQDLLIDSFISLDLPDSILLLIGDGPCLKDLKEKVAYSDFKDRIIFLGYQSNPFKYLRVSDVFVSCSEMEGFPNAIVEALACGLPVVSSDCLSGPREILYINSSVSANTLEVCDFGLLYPVNDTKSLRDALEMIYYDNSLRTKFSSLAFTRASDFDTSVIVEKFLSEIDSL